MKRILKLVLNGNHINAVDKLLVNNYHATLTDAGSNLRNHIWSHWDVFGHKLEVDLHEIGSSEQTSIVSKTGNKLVLSELKLGLAGIGIFEDHCRSQTDAPLIYSSEQISLIQSEEDGLKLIGSREDPIE